MKEIWGTKRFVGLIQLSDIGKILNARGNYKGVHALQKAGIDRLIRGRNVITCTLELLILHG